MSSLIPPELRADQGLVRAIGREVLLNFPPVEYAFSYGSMVMKQSIDRDYSKTAKDSFAKIDASKGSDMMDFIFAADSPQMWHGSNIEDYGNKHHYSTLLRRSKVAPFYLHNRSPGVIFNPMVPIRIKDRGLLDEGVPETINIKYGVVGMANLVEDLVNWKDMYLAGRMHKPITELQSNPIITMSRELNIHHATAYALLQLPSVFTEKEFYTKVMSISYEGDIRMEKKGEDPLKVEKLVQGNLPFLREMYSDVLSIYLEGCYHVSEEVATSIENSASNNPNQEPLNEGIIETLNKKSDYVPLYNNLGEVYQQMLTLNPDRTYFIQPNTHHHYALLATSIPGHVYEQFSKSAEKPDNPLPNSRNDTPYHSRLFAFGFNVYDSVLHQVSPYGEFKGWSMLKDQVDVFSKNTSPNNHQTQSDSMIRNIDDNTDTVVTQENLKLTSEARNKKQAKLPGNRRTKSLVLPEITKSDSTVSNSASLTPPSSASKFADTLLKPKKSFVKSEVAHTFEDLAVNRTSTGKLLAGELTTAQKKIIDADMNKVSKKAGTEYTFYDQVSSSGSLARYNQLYSTALVDIVEVEKLLPSAAQHAFMLGSSDKPVDLSQENSLTTVLLPVCEEIPVSTAFNADTTHLLCSHNKFVPNVVNHMEVNVSLANETKQLPFPTNLMLPDETTVLFSKGASKVFNDSHAPVSSLDVMIPDALMGETVKKNSEIKSLESKSVDLENYVSKYKESSLMMHDENGNSVVNKDIYLATPNATPSSSSLEPVRIQAKRTLFVPSQYSRQQHLKDPWKYDRELLPKYNEPAGETKSDIVNQMMRLKVKNVIPVSYPPPKDSKRQRWQVNSAFTPEQLEAEIAALGPNATKSQIDALSSKYINVRPAIYDPRSFLAGVARFDNTVRTLQVVTSAKFALYGAFLIRSDDIKRSTLYKHNISASSLNKHDLRSQSFTNKRDIVHIGQLTKNFEFISIANDWETEFKNHERVKVMQYLKTGVKDIVKKSSSNQMLTGFLSAGMVKSCKYVVRKLLKGFGRG